MTTWFACILNVSPDWGLGLLHLHTWYFQDLQGSGQEYRRKTPASSCPFPILAMVPPLFLKEPLCPGLSHRLRPRISHTGSKIHHTDPRKRPVQTLEAGLGLCGYGIPTSQVFGGWLRGSLRLQVSTPLWAHRFLCQSRTL